MSANLSPRREGARTRLRDTSGFTLVEVLVAFTVMATLLSVLFRGVVMMRVGSIAYDNRTHREIVALAVLDDALAQHELAPGRYDGVREGLPWTLVANSIDLFGQLAPPQPDESWLVGGMPGQAAPLPNVKAKTKPDWQPQQLIVRVGISGKPLEIETIHLVKAEGAP